MPPKPSLSKRQERFARADLTGTEIPDNIAFEGSVGHVNDTSQIARKIFVSLLLGCVYCWLTIATTYDPSLLTNSATSPLPIIQTEIPISGFYWVAPLILISGYLYLHLYLQRLWTEVATLPAVFPDGKELHQRIYPWLLNGLVRAHFRRLRSNRNGMSYVENVISVFLAWWIVPITLVVFWLRYLPRQDKWGTSAQVVYVIVAAAYGMATYVLARRTLRGTESKFHWTRPWADGLTYVAVGIIVLGLILGAASYGAICGVIHREEDLVDVDRDVVGLRKFIPKFFHGLGFTVFADFEDRRVSSTPEEYWQILKLERLDSASGARLKGASLRYLRGDRTFLAKANLKNADLHGASLQESILYRANLRRSNLYGADLEDADLVKADFCAADLTKADLEDAKIDEADLYLAVIEGIKLVKSDSPQRHDKCDLLKLTKNWEYSFRDKELECGGAMFLKPSIEDLDKADICDYPRPNGRLSLQPRPSE